MYAAVIVDNLLTNKELSACVERHFQHLPSDWKCLSFRPEHIRSPADYNVFLTSVVFWNPLQEFERVLIFQHDTGILKAGIEEFLEWDYVGAPWKINAPWARKDRAGGNGGLSIRCPKKSLDLITRLPYDGSMGNEDVFFTHHLDKVGGNVAPYEVCKRFSVETDYQLGTFGYHAIDKHLSEVQIQAILNQYA